MRRYFLLCLLCIIFFFLPLQIFIIGGDTGIGIQGSIYRYQITTYGTSFILLPREIFFIVAGVLTGKTALSVVFWVLGTILMTATLIYSFSHVNDEKGKNLYHQVAMGIISSCVLYLLSCVTQYGIFFHGPAGISMPIGIILIAVWTMILGKYPEIFSINIMRSD